MKSKRIFNHISILILLSILTLYIECNYPSYIPETKQQKVNKPEINIDLTNEYKFANKVYDSAVSYLYENNTINIDSIVYDFDSLIVNNSQLEGIVVLNNYIEKDNTVSLSYQKSQTLHDDSLCIVLENFKDTIIDDKRITFSLCFNGIGTNGYNDERYFSCMTKNCRFVISVSNLLFPKQKIDRLYYLEDQYDHSEILIQFVFHLNEKTLNFLNSKEYYPDSRQ